MALLGIFGLGFGCDWLGRVKVFVVDGDLALSEDVFSPMGELDFCGFLVGVCEWSDFWD